MAALTEDRRAVITGFGSVLPLTESTNSLERADTKKFFIRMLCEGKEAQTWKAKDYFINNNLPSTLANLPLIPCADFQGEKYFTKRELLRLDRFTQFFQHASSIALENSGVDLAKISPERRAISFGNAGGAMAYFDKMPRHSPTLATRIYPGSAAGRVAIKHDFQGLIMTNNNSCAAGACAIGEAMHWIREARADIILAGACETPLGARSLAIFENLGVLSSRAQRPFSSDRDGFVMAEGGVVFVVESLQSANRRGAKILAEIKGYSCACEANHMTRPEQSSKRLARTISASLDDAMWARGDVDYVNAHASSTRLNDANEARALAQVFGALKPFISGTKAITGHQLGAAGAVEVLVCILALQEDFIPPTLNCELSSGEFEEINVYAADMALPIKNLRRALSNSFGFGGINACLALEKVKV